MTTRSKKVVLYGNAQMATFAQAVLTHDSPYEVVAFTVDEALIKETTILGLPVVPFETVERTYPTEDFAAHIAVGFRRVNGVRAEKYYQAKEKGYELLTYVSSQAFKWPDLVIGDNCWILEHTILHPFVTIGNNVYLGSACHIGHNSTIGDHTFMAGLAGLAGGVNVGTHCFFGIHSTVRNGLSIADRCVIGAGATVLRSTRERGVYVAHQATMLPTPSDGLAEDFREGAGMSMMEW
jgi:sugar O-acyltransferase (sialic acid O-acetyltransferase NeuD family)